MNYKKAKGNLTFSLNYNYEDLEAAANLPPVQLFFKEVNKIYSMSLLHFKAEAFAFEEFKIWPIFFLYVMQLVNLREVEQLLKVHRDLQKFKLFALNTFISLCHRDFSRAKQLHATNAVSGMESHTLEH